MLGPVATPEPPGEAALHGEHEGVHAPRTVSRPDGAIDPRT